MECPWFGSLDFTSYRGFSLRVWVWKIAIATFLLSTVTSPVTKAEIEDRSLESKESEAKSYVAALNKAQQAYYLEYGIFVDSISKLGKAIEKSATGNYQYSIRRERNAVYNYGISRQANLRSVVGGVFLISNATETILCQAKTVGPIRPSVPIQSKGSVSCGPNTTQITAR